MLQENLSFSRTQRMCTRKSVRERVTQSECVRGVASECV